MGFGATIGRMSRPVPARCLPPTVRRPRCSGARWAVMACAAAGVALAGCALQPYTPPTASPQRAQLERLALVPDDPALRAPLAALGVEVSRWPLPAWDEAALQALALVLHPQVKLARAELAQAAAERRSGRTRAGAGVLQAVDLGLEHHGGSTPSPWTVSVAVDLGLSDWLLGLSRREARLAAADALADEAAQQAALSVWQVHRGVREAHRQWRTAARQVQVSERMSVQHQALAAAWQRRLSLGAADARQASAARRQAAEADDEAAAARAAEAQARIALGAALGLSGPAVAALVLAPADGSMAPVADPPLPLQQAALLDRLDVRAGLARFAAADAALRLALAQQLPELVLKPGWAWDQGERRWSIGLGVTLPVVGGPSAAIAEARARRDTEAARFELLQAQALADLAAARTAATAASQARERAAALADAAAQAQARSERRLAVGEADRLELLESRLLALAAQRRLLDAEAAADAARAALEDAIQRPLSALGQPREAQLAGGRP